MLQNRRIILGVTGSIAAYKSVLLLRHFKKQGATVRVVTTPSVDHFVGKLTFSALSDLPVFSGLWDEAWSEHVEAGQWADLMVIAPATAQTIAKMANGMVDNALTAVYLAAKCPVMVAPAMDVDMFLHPRTQANLETLKSDGVTVLPTESGFLASGLEGPGRMLEPEKILTHVNAHFSPPLLAGKKVLITAGPTREAIDPVRFLTNHSTGKMGYAIASTANSYGAEVTLISGPTNLASPPGVNRISVQSTQDMYEAVMKHYANQDLIIMSAAVSDFTPENPANEKIKKKTGEGMQISLKRTPDILATVGGLKKPEQFLMGFALETQNEEKNALRKLERKNLDAIVLNSLKDEGAGFGHDTNKITLLTRSGDKFAYPLKSKAEVARDILQKVVSLWSNNDNDPLV